MTASEIELRYLDAAEYPLLTDFYRRWLPNGERVAALFEWREAHPAESGGNRPLGAFREGKLLGTVNLNRQTIQGRGLRAEMHWYADTVVAPAARGRGIARRLVVRATEDSGLLLAKGSNEAMFNLRTGVGFRRVPNDGYMILPLTARAATENPRLKAAAPLLFAISKMRSRKSGDAELPVREIERFGPDYDRLAEAGAEAAWVSVVKSSAHLNWRYAASPLRDYRILEAHDGDGLRGAVVLRPPGRDDRKAWVVDLIAPLDDETAVDALLQAARDRATEEGAGSVRAFASAVAARRALGRVGFLPTGSTPYFTYFQRSAPDGILPPSAEWSFWHGDSDNEVY